MVGALLETVAQFQLHLGAQPLQIDIAVVVGGCLAGRQERVAVRFRAGHGLRQADLVHHE